ncbi:MAG: hypothetical protein JXC32_01750 [Anaerolineae bacterium]|nr:hypothetical protein [Anaerolineae bacterium]
MHALSEIVRRHFAPTLAMLREAITTCPEPVFVDPALLVREHIYHALVGMDVWLTPNPADYAFNAIVDDDAAELRAPATDRISREFLQAYLAQVEDKIAHLPDEADAYFAVITLRDREFTLLDRCLGQLRHAQHHIGVVNEKLRRRGVEAVAWRGYGED